MSDIESVLALRGSKGISFMKGLPKNEPVPGFMPIENPSCRDMLFTGNGSYFSCCSTFGAEVVECQSYQSLCKIDNQKIVSLSFSPQGTYLSTWNPYTAKENPTESCNLHIWETKTGKCIKSFIQKKQKDWNPQWSDDEKLCARNVNNEIHFFEDGNFGTIVNKMHLQKVAYFSLSPGAAPYHVACFVPGSKGQPSFVRLYKYPNFDGPGSVIAQKSFFKAERTDFYWNKTGKDCIFLNSVDVDKSGMSYYGELNLYYVSVKGDTAKVMLKKDGPVYSVQWSPNSKEFCVVYGYMPAKATIFDQKCNPVLDFDAAPRNEVNYSPVGNRLALSGFGNLQGGIEVWDLSTRKRISSFKAQDSTLIQWSSDGEYILTATTAPRLRIANGYRIWHYTGSLLVEVFIPKNEELYDIRWKPVPLATAKQTTFAPVAGIKSAIPEVSKEVYRPPAAQGKKASFKLHEEPPPSTDSSLTKNQKKKQARKAAAKKGLDKSSEDDPPVTEEIKVADDPEVEREKKAKNIKKKLDQIRKLKADQAAGKVLQIDQLEKIKKAGDLEAELAKLQLK